MKINYKKQNGFSLIEMALALLMVGIVTSTVLYTYNIDMKNKTLSISTAALADIDAALQNHVSTYGYYPLPADRSVPAGDADYGKSVALPPPWGTIPPCNNLLRGICRTGGNKVIIGGVPFKELHLSESKTYDAWNSRITYALTAGLMPDTALSSFPGEIIVEQSDVDGNTINNAHYVLVSHGERRAGGFNRRGIISDSCNLAEREHENCDNDDTFAADAYGRWRTFQYGADYFDDFVRFVDDINTEEWNIEASTPDDLRFTFDRVGIGVTDADARVDLHVVGDIKVDDWIKAQKICNDVFSDGSNYCFDPEAISGSKSDMRCDASHSLTGDQAMIGVANEKVKCSLGIDPSIIIPAPCAAGYLAVGFLPNGQLNCQLI